MSSSPPSPPSPDLHPFDGLVAVMRTLRSAEGCAWDRAQNLRSLRPYAIEELYEVLDAIEFGKDAPFPPPEQAFEDIYA